MNFLIALLRLIHIVTAVGWFGLAAAMATYVAPAVLAAGESGYRYFKALLTSTRIATAFPIMSGTAVVAGLLLYVTGDVNRNFSQTGQIVLGLGSLFGIAAAIHGGAVAGRATRNLGESVAKIGDNQPIPNDLLTTLREQAQEVASSARVSFILTVIALIGMGSARYL